MRLGILYRLDQLGDNVSGGWPIRIAHAKVDDIATRNPRLSFQRVDLAENIGWKTFDTVEILGHIGSRVGRRLLPSLGSFGESDGPYFVLNSRDRHQDSAVATLCSLESPARADLNGSR